MRWLILGILFVAAFCLRLYGIDKPPMDFSSTRQYHGALLARGLYEWLTTGTVRTLPPDGIIEPPILDVFLTSSQDSAEFGYCLTLAYRPWTNGQAERLLRTLKEPIVRTFYRETLSCTSNGISPKLFGSSHVRVCQVPQGAGEPMLTWWEGKVHEYGNGNCRILDGPQGEDAGPQASQEDEEAGGEARDGKQG